MMDVVLFVAWAFDRQGQSNKASRESNRTAYFIFVIFKAGNNKEGMMAVDVSIWCNKTAKYRKHTVEFQACLSQSIA
jgi:hypothetical protein